MSRDRGAPLVPFRHRCFPPCSESAIGVALKEQLLAPAQGPFRPRCPWEAASIVGHVIYVDSGIDYI